MAGDSRNPGAEGHRSPARENPVAPSKENDPLMKPARHQAVSTLFDLPHCRSLRGMLQTGTGAIERSRRASGAGQLNCGSALCQQRGFRRPCSVVDSATYKVLATVPLGTAPARHPCESRPPDGLYCGERFPDRRPRGGSKYAPAAGPERRRHCCLRREAEQGRSYHPCRSGSGEFRYQQGWNAALCL